MSRTPNLSYCGEIVRTHDRNRYLCALFAPTEIREAWFALFAFHYEITRIAHTVGEEMVGFVRYAWWRETIESVVRNAPPRGHPVAEALAKAVQDYRLPKEPFDRIIDAHEKAMVEKQELDEAFMEATSGALMQLCAHAAGLTSDASHAALGVALAGAEAAGLRAMDVGHRQHFITLAREKLAQAGKVDALLAPFAHTAEFYLARLEKGRDVNTVSTRAFWLPLTLWRRQLGA